MASFLAAVLLVLGGLDIWAVVRAVNDHASGLSGLIAGGVFALVFSVCALWLLQRVSTGRGGMLGASFAFAVAATTDLAVLLKSVAASMS